MSLVSEYAKRDFAAERQDFRRWLYDSIPCEDSPRDVILALLNIYSWYQRELGYSTEELVADVADMKLRLDGKTVPFVHNGGYLIDPFTSKTSELLLAEKPAAPKWKHENCDGIRVAQEVHKKIVQRIEDEQGGLWEVFGPVIASVSAMLLASIPQKEYDEILEVALFYIQGEDDIRKGIDEFRDWLVAEAPKKGAAEDVLFAMLRFYVQCQQRMNASTKDLVSYLVNMRVVLNLSPEVPCGVTWGFGSDSEEAIISVHNMLSEKMTASSVPHVYLVEELKAVTESFIGMCLNETASNIIDKALDSLTEVSIRSESKTVH